MTDLPITFSPMERDIGQQALRYSKGYKAKAAEKMPRRTVVRILMKVEQLSKEEARDLADQILAGGEL